MEGDKEAYLEEASKALKRQRKILDELLAEKNGIQRQLRVTKSKQNRNKDAENAAKIARLAEEQDTLIIMIKREIQALKDLGRNHLISFRRSDTLAYDNVPKLEFWISNICNDFFFVYFLLKIKFLNGTQDIRVVLSI